MTKIKNTKKGMAKKTLSVSLAVAMLATSNVPVWAAEFSDGADAAFTAEVEAPVEEAFADEEVPVVEEEVSEKAGAGDYTDQWTDLNDAKYVMNNIKLEVGDWNDTVSVSGTITTSAGTNAPVKYRWLIDGVAKSDTSNNSYTASKEDFNKDLSVLIYAQDSDGTDIFRKLVKGGKVKPVELSTPLAPEFNDAEAKKYDGTEKKLIPSNLDKFSYPDIFTKEMITWSYTTPGNDFTNFTDKEISVVASLGKLTYDPTSTAYGYTYTSKAGTYKVAKRPIGSSNMVFNFKKTSVPYIGGVHTFKLSDVTVSVKMPDNTKIDITNAFDSDTVFVGTDVNVGENYTSSINLNDLDTADTDEAKAILTNYSYEQGDAYINAENTYEITQLDLSKCTGVITKEYTVDAFEKASREISAENIRLTTPDGTIFNLADLVAKGDITIHSEANITTGKLQAGVPYQNAIKVSYKDDNTNVANTLYLTLTLANMSLSDTYVDVKYNGNWTSTTADDKLVEDKTNTSKMLDVPYIASAYDLQKSKCFSNFGLARKNNPSEVVSTLDYELSYNDNVSAGIVEVTIKGKNSYAGSTKKVYFKINQHGLKDTDLNTKSSVTINVANNKDASLYKDALDAVVKTELSNKSTVTLKEGDDYTVKYYYADKAGCTTEEEIKENAGKNTVGNYLYVVVTPVKGGNYTNTLVKGVRISEKSIAGVTVTLDKDSYTFTGKEIVPKVTVKDGSSILDSTKDYLVKVTNNINVGTATVSVIPRKGSEYDTTTSATTTFEITPAKAEDVKITLKANSSAIAVSGKQNTFKYNKGKQVKPDVVKVELNGVDVTEYFDTNYPVYGENVNAGKESGSVTIAPIDTTKNFTGTKTHLFDIKGIELKGTLKAYYNDKTEITVPSGNVNGTDVRTHTAVNKKDQPYSFYYDGVAQTFAETRFNASGLVDVSKDKDYEIKYINNVDAGTAFVAVVAKGNYEGTLDLPSFPNNWAAAEVWKGYNVVDGSLMKGSTVIEKNIVDIIAFVINPTYFTAKNITIENGKYAGGLAVRPEVTVTVAGKTLVEGKDYTLKLSAIDNTATPDKFVHVTTGKPYYVTVVPMGGYDFDNVNGTNKFVWGIDKKDLKDCDVTVDKAKDGTLTTIVKNGTVTETKEEFKTVNNGDGTATVSVVDDGKNYTGSKTVDAVTENQKPATPVLTAVNVTGNKATAVLSGECEGAEGYDFVISKDRDCITNKDYEKVNKNILKTQTDFTYVQQGTYYAYCHAWKRGEDGKKVFSDWSNAYPFAVTAITPDQPVVTSVKVSGSTVTVTYTKAANADGYDVVLGTKVATVAGEKRPVEYGTLVKKNIKGNTVTATFKNVKKGTYYAGLHAFNRTSEDNKKVFSPWSNSKKVVVK